ncbi:hypothetical protein H1P_2490003 [Hyella patelloides LEGE 07179]|uniref:Uncharacterized protein n=1 Tax=Hyella patelloides LEGE 07179 TaxID=945734 RepID=A0A563VSC7_9CYAN|nr:hypothetical protein H1P_2490003 [Hyella patelloides LEGE 07179]
MYFNHLDFNSPTVSYEIRAVGVTYYLLLSSQLQSSEYTKV